MFAFRHRNAFTLVELLIVIVVIAVLATITVVAYNGMTERAYVAKAGSATRTFETALNLFKAESGNLPVTNVNGQEFVCVGEEEDYPAKGVFSLGQCVYDPNGFWAGDVYVKADFNQKFKSPVLSLPDGSLPVAGYGPVKVRGIYYYSDDPQGISGFIEYFIPGGNTSCPMGQLVQHVEEENFTICSVEVGGGHDWYVPSPGGGGAPVPA